MAQNIPSRGSQGPRPGGGRPVPKPQAQPTPVGKERAIPKLPPKTPRPAAQQKAARRPPEEDEKPTPVELGVPLKAPLGNKVGYLIAGLLVVGIGAFLTIKLVFPGPSDPVNVTQAMLELKIPGPVAAVIGSEPSGSGNAADDYTAALQLSKACNQDVQNSSEKVAQSGGRFEVLDDAVVQKLKAIDDKIAAGAAKAKMDMVKPEDLAYTQNFPLADDFINILFVNQLILARYYFDKKDFASCEKVLLHLFTMGWHMMNERAKMQITLFGMSIQQQVLTANPTICLTKLYQTWPTKQAREKELQAYDSSLFSAKLEADKKRQYLWCTTPKPGDVFRMIEGDKDKIWVVESLLILGNIKFSAAERGDIRYANKLMDEFINDKDPLKAAAAKAAKNLTLDEYKSSGTMGQ
ncbi:MAG: hypothetical protein HZA50_14350 [Planctomycetes bacterium]|nr:hypothetical protein [Planctomycetota bacterium]